MAPQPDETVEHESTRCASCGENLAADLVEGIERRRVFDTPDPVLICTEHRALSKRCCCRRLTKESFPRKGTAPASYAPNVRTAALYLLFGRNLSREVDVSATAGRPTTGHKGRRPRTLEVSEEELGFSASDLESLDAQAALILRPFCFKVSFFSDHSDSQTIFV